MTCQPARGRRVGDLNESTESGGRSPGGALLIVIDGWRGALPLDSVREVARAVAITPLSGSSGPLLGFINVRGEIVPVADSRAALHLPRREPSLTDRFVLVSCTAGAIAVPVDDAVDVVRLAPLVDGDGLARTMRAAEPPWIEQVRGLQPARVGGTDSDVVVLIDPDVLFGEIVAGWRPQPTAGADARPVHAGAGE